MTTTAPAIGHNVISGHGTVHHKTVGKTYRFRGYSYTNQEGNQFGKMDCGAITSSAAALTDQAVNCSKCAAVGA